MLPCDILIKNAAVLMPDMSIARNQTIAISGSRILEIADTDNSDQTISYQAETVIDDPHLLWMPAFWATTCTKTGSSSARVMALSRRALRRRYATSAYWPAKVCARPTARFCISCAIKCDKQRDVSL